MSRKGRKKAKDGNPIYKAGDENYSSIKNYAVNGAIHYANAIINSGGYSEVIAIGVNGTQLNDDGSVKDAECKAYYISKKNNCVPKEIHKITSTDWSLLKKENIDSLYEILDGLNLTEADIEALTRRTEAAL